MPARLQAEASKENVDWMHKSKQYLDKWERSISAYKLRSLAFYAIVASTELGKHGASVAVANRTCSGKSFVLDDMRVKI